MLKNVFSMFAIELILLVFDFILFILCKFSFHNRHLFYNTSDENNRNIGLCVTVKK